MTTGTLTTPFSTGCGIFFLLLIAVLLIEMLKSSDSAGITVHGDAASKNHMHYTLRQFRSRDMGESLSVTIVPLYTPSSSFSDTGT